jgi:hypothetical protein
LPLVSQSGAGALLKGDSVTLSVQLPPGVNCSQFQWRFSGVPISGATSTNLTLSDLQFPDDGDYHFRCYYASFSRYVTSFRHRIRVYGRFTSPMVAVQPKSVVGRNGGSAVFTVGASGTPPFTYQWLKNGAPISGATNFFLSLTNLQAASVANYSAMVSNQVGSTNSSTATLVLVNAPASNPTADALVSSGRASLTIHTNSSLQSAYATIATAVSMDPQNETGNFFLATVRLVNLINQPGVTNLMNRLLVSPGGRDPYGWTAQPSRHADGRVVVPAGINMTELITFAKTNLLPEIRGAQTNLSGLLNPDFSTLITPIEVGASPKSRNDPVLVDQGDITLGRAFLSSADYAILTANSWNLSILLSAIESISTNNALSIESVLRDYPELMTFSDISQLTTARTSLEASIDDYVQAMGIIRSRVPGKVHLFNLDSRDLLVEERFRQGMLDLKGSLDVAMVVNELPQITGNIGKLIDGSQSPRSLLPGFKENLPQADSVPSKTLNGVVSVVGKPFIVIPPRDVTSQPGAVARFAVTAVGSEPMTYQWQRNGTAIPGANSATLVVPRVGLNEQGQYQVVVSNAEGSAASDSVSLRSSVGGIVMAWGANFYGPISVPAGLDDAIAVAAGNNHCLALKADGTVVGWGNNAAMQATPPAGVTNVIGISCGSDHSLALRANGTVVGWGGNGSGQISIPYGLDDVVAIAAGSQRSMALKANGTVVGWGNNDSGQLNIPQGLSDVVAISLNDDSTLALKSDGTVVGWGSNARGQLNIPTGLDRVVAIASGWGNCVALRKDGSVVQWGASSYRSRLGDYNNGKAIACDGFVGSMLLRNDGSVVFQGESYIVPTDLNNVSAIAVGYQYCLVLGPFFIFGPYNKTYNVGETASFNATVQGLGPFSYQWLFNGNPISGANNPTFEIANVQPSAAGNYAIQITSPKGAYVSQTAKLAVNADYDRFAARRYIPGGGGHILGSTTTATKEPGEPAHAGNTGGKSLWFNWQAPMNANVTIDTLGSSFDTVLAVYTGSSLTNLTLVGSDDDGGEINLNSRLTFAAQAGVNYLVAVDGYNGASGGVALNITPHLTLGNLVRTSLGGLKFSIVGPQSSNLVVEASPNLKAWVPLSSNTMPENGLVDYTDTQTTNQTRKFYRAVVK